MKIEPLDSTFEALDMPKIQSPFERDVMDNKYVCVPKIKPGFEWVFKNSVAVEKLDGTNVSVELCNNSIIAIRNRLNLVDIWSDSGRRFFNGVSEALNREYFSRSLANGRYFGELIGEKIQGNPYKITSQCWFPLDVLKRKYEFRFWQDVLKDLESKSEEEIFTIVRGVFIGLWSLLKRRTLKGITFDAASVNENTTFSGFAAEGIVFYSQDNPPMMAKLRRDMFDFFKGNDHQPRIKTAISNV